MRLTVYLLAMTLLGLFGVVAVYLRFLVVLLCIAGRVVLEGLSWLGGSEPIRAPGEIPAKLSGPVPPP